MRHGAKQVGARYDGFRQWIEDAGHKQLEETEELDKQRIRALERELKAARMEHDILKEAAIFHSDLQ